MYYTMFTWKSLFNSSSKECEGLTSSDLRGLLEPNSTWDTPNVRNFVIERHVWCKTLSGQIIEYKLRF